MTEPPAQPTVSIQPNDLDRLSEITSCLTTMASRQAVEQTASIRTTRPGRPGRIPRAPPCRPRPFALLMRPLPNSDTLAIPMEIRERLAQAAFDGNIAEVKRLIDTGADIDADGRNWNPIHAAIENDKVSCVRLLLDRGADVERPGHGYPSPLAHAVDISVDGTIQSGGSQGEEPIEVILLLLSAGAKVEAGLAVARRYGSQKIDQLLTSSKGNRLA